MARPPSPSTSADSLAPYLNRSEEGLESRLLRAFDEFIEEPQRFLDQYNIDREGFIDYCADANCDDPFMVSDRCADGWEDADSPVEPQVNFYTARLVENYTVNELRGEVLRKETNHDFQKKFPVPEGLYETEEESDDNQQEYSSQKEDTSDEENTQQGEGEHHNQDEPRWLEHISQFCVRLQVPVQFLVSVISDGLWQGLTNLGHIFNVLWSSLRWVWTSPVLNFPRRLFGNIFWCGLAAMTILFISSFLWDIAVDKVQYALSYIPFFESRHTNPLPDLTSLSPAVYDFVNLTNPLPDVLDNFTQIANLAVDLQVVQKVLTVAEEDLVFSKSIIGASEIPYRQVLKEHYEGLQNNVLDLSAALDEFDVQVKSLVWRVKIDVGDTLKELDKLSIDFDLPLPLPNGFMVERVQAILNTVTVGCGWYLAWNGPYSMIFCGSVFGLSSFLNNEISCREFANQAMPKPNRCLFLLADGPETSVVQQREKAFRVVEGIFLSFLDRMDTRLDKISMMVKEPKMMLDRTKELRETIIETMKMSLKQVLEQDTDVRISRDEGVKRWNSRPLDEKLQDWWAGRDLPVFDVMKMVRIQGQERDLSTLHSMQKRIGNGLGRVSEATKISRNAILTARQQIQITREYFEERFCIGVSPLSADRNCGTNHDFMEAINTIIEQLYEIKPLLEHIEAVGLMSKEVESGIEKTEQELEMRCEAIAVSEEEQLKKSGTGMSVFIIAQRRKQVKRICVLQGWLDKIV